MNDKNRIDFEKLRDDLLDYFGTAMVNVSDIAMMNLSHISTASNEELLMFANKYSFDLNEYLLENKIFKH